jgi:hypothetical protein
MFHGPASYADLIRDFRELCLEHLGYEFIRNLQDTGQILFFDRTMNWNDHSKSEENFLYVEAKDYSHFKKPTILGLNREGLLIETNLDGWTESASRILQIKKLRVDDFKIHGYGKTWGNSQADSQLEDEIRDALLIPRNYKLRLLTEEYMREAVERLE